MSRFMVYNVQQSDDENEQATKMSKREKKKFKLKFEKKKARSGPYEFQGRDKCEFDSRPRKTRTRRDEFNSYLKGMEE